MTCRRRDWEKRLRTYIRSHADTPFAWGTHDCAMATAGAIEAMTGVDPAAAHRGQYSTEAEALARLPEHTIGWELGCCRFEEIPPLQAQRGDAVGVQLDTGFALGFVGLGGMIVLAGETGWTRLRLARAVRAWRVA